MGSAIAQRLLGWTAYYMIKDAPVGYVLCCRNILGLIGVMILPFGSQPR
jgi:hypothetical protein